MSNLVTQPRDNGNVEVTNPSYITRSERKSLKSWYPVPPAPSTFECLAQAQRVEFLPASLDCLLCADDPFLTSSSGNVVPLPEAQNRRSAFDNLTVTVALARLKAGTLAPNVLVALLAAVGVLE